MLRGYRSTNILTMFKFLLSKINNERVIQFTHGYCNYWRWGHWSFSWIQALARRSQSYDYRERVIFRRTGLWLSRAELAMVYRRCIPSLIYQRQCNHWVDARIRHPRLASSQTPSHCVTMARLHVSTRLTCFTPEIPWATSNRQNSHRSITWTTEIYPFLETTRVYYR